MSVRTCHRRTDSRADPSQAQGDGMRRDAVIETTLCAPAHLARKADL